MTSENLAMTKSPEVLSPDSHDQVLLNINDPILAYVYLTSASRSFLIRSSCGFTRMVQ